MKSVEVEIFGRQFRLRGDNPEDIETIAGIIDTELNELRDIYENLDFTKLLLLLTLKKQDEINALITKTQALEKDLERLNLMLEKIVGDI